MKQLYLVTIQIESFTNNPELLAAIMSNVLETGLEQYNILGELQPFDTLTVLQSPPEAQSDEQIRLRRMGEDYLHRMQRIVEKRLTYRVEEASQATLPGL